MNVPIIEYTFEFLAISGVQEVILFCRSHSDQLKQYLNKSRWSKATSTMHIQVVTSPECSSLGDALRDIDSKAIIQGDFILVSGDVVSNMNLARALTVHRARRQADKNLIMTMVLKPSTPFHRSRERCETAVFCVDPVTNECLHYEPIESETQKLALKMEAALLEGHRAIDVRYDLIDCQIDICSQHVLALFTENFDYQDMRKDFVRGVLQCDILGHKIGCYELASDEYAARVRSSHLYDSVSRDIIGRWTFPIVPDMNLIEDQELSIRRGNRYIGKDVMLSRSAQVGSNSVLGKGVSVGEGSVIIRSVLGPKVTVGPNCRIVGSYLWEGVIVEGGAVIESSIIADGACIRPGVTIGKGCMITSQVTIGPRVVVPANTRVAKWSDHLERTLSDLNLAADGAEGSGSLSVSLTKLSASSRAILGPDSDGLLWTAPMLYDPENADDYLDVIPAELVAERTAAFTIGSEFHHTPLNLPSDDEADIYGHGLTGGDDVSEGDQDGEYNEFMDQCFTSATSHTVFNSREAARFYDEAYEMTRQSVLSSYTIDNTSLELNALKFACNASFRDCRRAVICALASLIDPARMAASVAEVFTAWAPLLVKFIHAHADQTEIIAFLHEYLVKNPALSLGFHVVLPQLYKLDVLEDEAIINWYAKHIAQASEGEQDLFARQVKGFVAWLEESDGEEEDEDEGEEEEEEEEDS